MYIPAWPSLNPATLIGAASATMPFPLSENRCAYYYVARYGIYHLLRTLGYTDKDVVLAPDYHHGNEIYAIKAAGASIRYYPVDDALNADVERVRRLLRNGARAVYVTHFIGFPQPIEEIRALCDSTGATLIEDCALAFLSSHAGRALGEFGDHAVFCLYKSVPVPNGGVIVANGKAADCAARLPVARPSRVSVASRSVDLLIQWLRMRNDAAGSLMLSLKRGAGATASKAGVERLPVGNTGFHQSAVSISMSPLSTWLLPRFNFGRVYETRRRNYGQLADALRPFVRLLPRDLVPGVCPLFFPLLVEDKQRAYESLLEKGIETVQFWNEGDAQAHGLASASGFLRRHLLEVPIHQDLTPDHVELIGRQILRLQLGMRV